MAFENLKSTGIKYVLTKLKDVFLQIKDAVKSVNDEEPDENGNIVINSVPYAQNLESESSHRNYDTFIQRTAGGDSSVGDGNAWLMVVRGGNTHDGYSPESIDMVVTPVERENPIDATLNRDVFVGYVAESGTIILTYTGSAWSADPTLYGITVNGTPVDGDVITIVYVAEVRGTITVANPHSFVSTGWNLFDSSNGYAKVIKYAFGYRIDGTYTSIKYSATLTGAQSDIVVTDHNFDIPADGYIFVTGGNGTDIAIYPVWEDWSEGTTETFEPYSESVIDLSTIMSTSFPYGLMKAETALDEIDLNLGQAISRVERLTYTAENLAIAKNSGREFEYDENYIYLVRATPLVVSISVDGDMIVNDHGIEYFTDTIVPVYTEILYGNNLKNKLERDVLTISSQSLTASQKAQVQSNLDVPSNANAVHKTEVVNNASTTSAGYVLDARMGKTLNGLISAINEVVGDDINIGKGTLTAHNITVPSGNRSILIVAGNGNAKRLWIGYIYCNNSGSVSYQEIYKGDNATFSTSTNKVTITFDAASSAYVRSFNLYGNPVSSGDT